LRTKKPIVVTIGVFDGVHLGHQALLRETVVLSKRLKAQPWVLTFQDHPVHILRGGPLVPFLLPRQKTFELLKEKGAREVHAIRFTKVFSRKSPERFVQWLRSKGRLKGVVVGENFRFGKGAVGDVSLLASLGRRYGFTVKAVKPVKVGAQAVSSSRIRRALAEGRNEEANRMLGRSYTIEGEVVHGKHVGHKIGFPTANLRAIQNFLPKDGVYACAVELGSKVYRAGMNLGKRPTFKDDDHHRQAEVHLLHYYGRLYGKTMKVHLLRYLRPERKFASSSALVRQIRKDLAVISRMPLPRLK
jgi:riboflavin kinase/FMN adenylyltransferase